jgi:DNA-binding response OmpR family regulator
MNILIVEDSLETREVIRDIINSEMDNVTIFETENGERALEILELNSIDILITGIMISGTDGFEFVRQVKKDITLPNTFIVAITDLNGDEHMKKLFDNGIDYYISKPVQQEDIISRLKLITKLVDNQKEIPKIARDTFNPFEVDAMINFYTVFAILQEADLYTIIHYITTLYPKVNRIMLKDFITILLKSYESLDSTFSSPFEIKLESSFSDLFLSCSDLKFIQAIKKYEESMPSYETIYLPHSSMTIKIPIKG